MSNINTRVEKLVSEGLTLKKIRAYLEIDDYSAKEIAEATKGLSTVKKGFRAAFHSWLVEAPRTEEEAAEYIEGFGEYGETSTNVKKHRSVYLNEYRLAKSIRDSLAS